MKTLSDAEAAKKFRDLKLKEKRYTIKMKLLIKKATEKGLSVSEAEIDTEIARMKKS